MYVGPTVEEIPVNLPEETPVNATEENQVPRDNRVPAPVEFDVNKFYCIDVCKTPSKKMASFKFKDKWLEHYRKFHPDEKLTVDVNMITNIGDLPPEQYEPAFVEELSEFMDCAEDMTVNDLVVIPVSRIPLQPGVVPVVLGPSVGGQDLKRVGKEGQ